MAVSTLEAVLQSGLAADKPAATDVGSGTLYVSTDTGLIEQSDGTSWSTWLDLTGIVGGSFQPLDSDLTAIAGLTPSNDDIVQRKAGAWTNRTMAQLIADLAALGTTFQPLDSDLTAIAALATSSYGRNLLTLANVAALYTALSVDTDGTLAADSDTKIPSQKAVKTYADALLGAAHALEYKGVTDCSANPNYPAGAVGDLYIVSVAGKIGGASGAAVSAGDLFVCITANAGGTQASVGADWDVVHATATGSVTGPGSATSDDFATYNGTSGSIIKDSGVKLDTDGTLAADSDAKIASQKAVKTYVDAAVAGGGGSSDVLHTVASSGASQTVDFSTADVWDITLTAACTLSLSGFTNGDPDFLTLILRQDGTGSRLITWPTITWIGSGLAPILQTAPGSVDTVVLFSVDGGTTVFGIAQTSQSGLKAGTSFPGSPSDGDLFYRTDRRILYEYVSAVTKWLSVDRKYVPMTGSRVLNGAGNVTGIPGFWALFEDVYIESWVTLARMGGTNNGSNFGTATLKKQSPAEVDTTVASFSTSADSPSTNVVHTVSVAAVIAAASFPCLYMSIAATGSPSIGDYVSQLVVRSVG